DFANSTGYYVNIAATNFDDVVSNSYAGIADNGTWNFTTVAGGGGGGAVSNGWTNSAWNSRLKLTVDNTKVNGDLTDFPVYIDLSDLSSANFFGNVRSDGGEIRITQGDGLTLLPTELVSIDTTNNQGELWFKAPFLDASADTIFYIYYNNANATTLNADDPNGKYGVWSNGYVAVYHMNDDPSATTANSVSNDLHGTASGSMTSADKVAGQVGNGSDMDGTDDYINASSTGFSVNTGTISFWAKLDVTTADFGAWQMYTGDADNFQVWYDGSTNDKYHCRSGSNAIIDAASATSDTNWHHVSCDYNFTSDNYYMYLDGSSTGSSTTAYSAPTLVSTWDIGRRTDSATQYEFDGKLDEIHIASKVRSSDWINTEYNNQNSASTFYTVGSTVEGVGDDGLPKVLSTYPNHRQDRFPLAANFTITFNENVQAGSGNITLKLISDNSTVEAIAIGSCTISGATVTINPSSNLTANTEYYIEIDDGAIEDTGSNAFIGFRNTQSWRFTSEGGSSTINSPASIFIFGE
ncbi:MAG: DUF2341 domain-containing protein, partial [Candidatus Melainabacteria bacterium]|nr:DUF2341 domain-containing protein [Candidatus Melainabacteria bacterium]